MAPRRSVQKVCHCRVSIDAIVFPFVWVFQSCTYFFSNLAPYVYFLCRKCNFTYLFTCQFSGKYVRDRFVKAKQRLQERSGDPGRVKPLQALYMALQWLYVNVKPQESESNMLASVSQVEIINCAQHKMSSHEYLRLCALFPS